MKTRPNSYPGVCTECGVRVEEGDGLAYKADSTAKWRVKHQPGACPKAELPTVAATVDDEALQKAVNQAVGLVAREFMTLVPSIVEENLHLLSRVETIQIGKAPAIKIKRAHSALPQILTAAVAGAHPFLVGPAGSGKTTLAEQIATTMRLKFYMASRVTSDFKLLGFINAAGTTVRTPFREAYEHGGLFLFDEIDASDADALTAFNAALSNGHCDFPDGLIKAHKDFHAIAAGNTYGRGADRQYVGRNQLDAATLDRFTVFTVDYDEQLELELSGNAEWCRHVQRIRAVTLEAGIRHIVSPRASIIGARLLAAGMPQEDVLEACVYKGLDAQNKARIEGGLAMHKITGKAKFVGEVVIRGDTDDDRGYPPEANGR